MSQRRGPGLTKVRRVPLFSSKDVRLSSSTAGRWRELLEAADVVSEGGTREEPGGAVYYGTTSVLLPAIEEEIPRGEGLTLIAADPHLRVLVIRLARREAAARAGAPLSSMRTEVMLRRLPEGLSVLVDVAARVSGRKAKVE